MKNVLILEDDLEQAELLSMNLKAAGHIPRLARSAEEAARLIEEELPDVVVADVLIKSGEAYVPDGALRLLQIIRGQYGLRDLPVYIVTGAGPGIVDMVKTSCENYAITRFLPKPYDMRALARSI